MNRTLTATLGMALLAATGCTTIESTPSTTLAPLEVEDTAPTTVEITSPAVTYSPSTQRSLFIYNIETTINGPVYDEDGAVETGYLVCDALRTGSSIEAVMGAALDSAVTSDQVLFLTALVASAVTVFCPDMSYLIEAL